MEKNRKLSLLYIKKLDVKDSEDTFIALFSSAANRLGQSR